MNGYGFLETSGLALIASGNCGDDHDPSQVLLESVSRTVVSPTQATYDMGIPSSLPEGSVLKLCRQRPQPMVSVACQVV